MEQTGSKLLVEALKANGTKYLFGLIGAHTEPVYDVFYDDPAIKHIFVRHEQCISFAAGGYAKVTGQPGIGLVVPGPGTTNLVTGVAAAYCDSLPMVLITAQTPPDLIGRGIVHECDEAAILKPIVKEQLIVHKAGDIPDAIRKAFCATLEGRPGPVQVLITAAILRQRTEPKTGLREIESPPGESGDLDIKLKQAAGILGQAANPIIYAGYGTIQASATVELRKLSERISAPVLTSIPARGAISEDHPLCFGTLFFKEAKDILAKADACLAIGTRFSEWSTDGWTEFPSDLIQIDTDAQIIGLNYPVKIGLVGDAKHILRKLLAMLPEKPAGSLVDLVHSSKENHAREVAEFMSKGAGDPVHPLWLVKTLRDCLPPETIVVADASASQLWFSEQAFVVFEPRTLLVSEVFQEIGSAVQTGIGAKVGCPDRPVVCVQGDGGMMYQLGEIATAVAHGLPLLIIILDDGYYNIPRVYQEMLHNGRYIGVKLNNPDFVKLAKSLGAKGYRLNDHTQLPRLVNKALQGRDVVLLDVPIDIRPIPSRTRTRVEHWKKIPPKPESSARVF